MKKDATESFSAQKFQEAIDKFSECLELDPLNNSYNSAIMFNRSIAFSKLGDNSSAMKDLDRAIEMNEDYTKAYIKRGEINMSQ